MKDYCCMELHITMHAHPAQISADHMEDERVMNHNHTAWRTMAMCARIGLQGFRLLVRQLPPITSPSAPASTQGFRLRRAALQARGPLAPFYGDARVHSSAPALLFSHALLNSPN